MVPVGGRLQRDQCHRPQTVAVGIADSPVGQPAWSELFNSFGNGTSLVSREQILTQVSLYWFTNTQATAAEPVADLQRFFRRSPQ